MFPAVYRVGIFDQLSTFIEGADVMAASLAVIERVMLSVEHNNDPLAPVETRRDEGRGHYLVSVCIGMKVCRPIALTISPYIF